MENMVCYDCVLKHLSAALSYGKQIMSGHSKGSSLDHRIDFLGQIVNAEHHLQLFDKMIFQELCKFRKDVQAKDIIISFKDLEIIRQLFFKTELKKISINKPVNSLQIIENPDIVYLPIKNKQSFQFSQFLIKKYLTNYNNIYIMNQNETIFDFVNKTESKNIIVLDQSMSILKQIDAKNILPSFNIIQNKFNYDNVKLQPINIQKFKSVIKQNCENTLTKYYNEIGYQGIHDLDVTVNVNRKICCSIKTSLHIKTFIKFMPEYIKDIKEELKINI